MRAAAVQLNSTNDKGRNLEAAGRLVREAALDGARLVALPEKWNVLGTAADLDAGAETLEGGTSIDAAREWARELGIDLLAGSIAERVEGAERLFNTSALIDSSRGDRRRLSQDPHVRRRGRRRHLPRIGARAAG